MAAMHTPAFFDAALARLYPGETPRRALADAWQGWVQVILTEHADDPALIEMTA